MNDLDLDHDLHPRVTRPIERARTLRRALAAALLGLATLAGGACGGGEEQPETLTLSLTSEAPVSGEALESLRVLFLGDGGLRYPADPDARAFTLPVGPALDPVARPVTIALSTAGATFPDGRATIHVVGRVGSRAVTIYSGPVELGAREVLEVRLRAVQQQCDGDGDGFLDCAITGCCAPGEEAFADCEPLIATASPWGVEPECVPCGPAVDRDCDGVATTCDDADSDGVADCLDCDPADPTVGQGLPELCDLKDNTCDGRTDEGYFIIEAGVALAPGQACGLGACEGGVVVCADTRTAVCSTAGDAVGEICGDGIDNDCDGLTDEGCEAGDLDGDGFTVEAGDCDDRDSSYFPGAPERCCPASAEGTAAEAACDTDCDGDVTFCDPADLDGDGFTVEAGDCDDADPRVYPGAPERCGDGVDQDCDGADLSCDGVVDADGDGWSSPVDCDDTDPAVYPGATERCDGRDNDCDGFIDDGNPDTADSGACGTAEGECEVGVFVCVNSGEAAGEVQCVGFVGPGVELCDGLDNDCDGETDEGFDDYTDLDGTTGLQLGDGCGVGACMGGTVVCDAAGTGLTCSTRGDARAEVCDGLDNDCDGGTDEEFRAVADGGTGQVDHTTADGTSGLFLGDGCGVGACDGGTVVCADLVSLRCDTDHLAGAEVCDDADNDCDGDTDEDFTDGTFTVADLDGAGALVKGDGCGVGACGVGAVVCGPDGGLVCSVAALRQPEVCDGLDNDCDGEADEDFGPGGTFTLTDTDGAAGLVKGDACGVGACDPTDTATVQCDPVTRGLMCASVAGVRAQPTPERCDGLDNDCDGETDEDFVDVADGGGGLVSFTDYDAARTTRYLGQPCGREGVCADASPVVACHPDGTRLVCADLAGAEVRPQAETCDGLDNDCDGAVDEDFRPDSGDGSGLGLVGFADFEADRPVRFLGEDCGRSGVCAARAGTVQCDASTGLPACADAAGAPVVPSAEVCDLEDNDCDGFVDEDFHAEAGDGSGLGTRPLETLVAADTLGDRFLGDACGLGACAGGVVACDLATGRPVCDQGGAPIAPAPETCDGLDNDCDGVVDEDFRPLDVDGGLGAVGLADFDGAVRHLDEACGRAGACAASEGTVQCSAGGQLVCADAGGAPVAPGIELCDGVDNDCDGATDEDYGPGGTITYPDALAGGGVAPRVLGDDCGLGACRAQGAVVACDPVSRGLMCGVESSPGVFAPVVGGPEVCDGVDNDCDGDVDEGLGAVVDPAVTGCSALGVCGAGGSTGACAFGEAEATASGFVCTYGHAAYRAGDELGRCDGLDNDCDGQTDEDFGAGGTVTLTDRDGSSGLTLGAGCGVGVCAGGAVVCDPQDPAALACTSHVSASADLCDGLDNDCDGDVDEDFGPDGGTRYLPRDGGAGLPLGAACGLGACGASVVACGPDRVSLVCPSDALAAAEVCDGVDDDCDGATDEGLDIVAADVVGLAVAGCRVAGVCAGALSASCEGGAWVCGYDAVADYEADEASCDARDNDCDGAVDEGLEEVSTADTLASFGAGGFGCTIAGVCAAPGAIRARCAADVPGVEAWACTYLADGWEAVETRCDGVDNDCDGEADEPFRAGAANTTAYTPIGGGAPLFLDDACGAGVCAGGTVVCGDDALSLACTTDGAATAEVCDGADNDCDGAIDDGTDIPASDTARLDAVGCSRLGVCAGVVTATCGGAAGYVCDYASVADYAVTEVCDGRDNDCDGEVDEGLVLLSPASGLAEFAASTGCAVDGVCGAAGAVRATCDVTTVGTAAYRCDYLAADYEADETRCDDRDNDCDGAVDEGISVSAFGGAAEAAAAGCLTAGVCVDASQTSATCNAGVTPGWTCAYGQATFEATEASCDGLDNDCDGAVDEGISVTNAAGNADVAAAGCLTDGVCGALGQTTATCRAGGAGAWDCAYGAADYEVVEVSCDGVDNDCDGTADGLTVTGDPGLIAAAGCSVSGVCADTSGTTTVCAEGSGLWTCSYGQALYTPGPDESGLCDGRDNDCDGTTDEGFGLGAVCNDDPLSRCYQAPGGVAGQRVCDPADPTATVCSTDVYALTDDAVCDGVDGDCDGAVDEDYAEARCDAVDPVLEAGDGCFTALSECMAGGEECGEPVTDCGGALGCAAGPGGEVDLCVGCALDDDCGDGVCVSDFGGSYCTEVCAVDGECEALFGTGWACDGDAGVCRPTCTVQADCERWGGDGPKLACNADLLCEVVQAPLPDCQLDFDVTCPDDTDSVCGARFTNSSAQPHCTSTTLDCTQGGDAYRVVSGNAATIVLDAPLHSATFYFVYAGPVLPGNVATMSFQTSGGTELAVVEARSCQSSAQAPQSVRDLTAGGGVRRIEITATGATAWLDALRINAPTDDLQVFVTSSASSGGVGNASTRDATCQGLADGAGSIQVGGGTFRAWVSDASTNLMRRFTIGAGRYVVREDATTVSELAADFPDVVDGSLSRPINRDETGAAVGVSSVWTGTNATGLANANTCLGWTANGANATGLVGVTSSQTGAWTASSSPTCNASARLYCFEQAPPAATVVP